MHAVVMMAVSAAAAAAMPINACAGGEVALRKWMVERYGSELGMGECTVGMQRRPHNARTSCHT